MKKIRAWIVGIVAILLAYAAYADTVTLSTFYPSPHGSYQNLDTTGVTHLATGPGNVVVGSTDAGLAKLHVAHAIDKTVAAAVNVGTFTTSDANVFL